MDTLVTRPEHSLVSQSLNTKMRYKPDGSILAVNGDGFGIGWYGKKEEPGLYKVSDPAWSNENIHAICSQTESGLFMAHSQYYSTHAECMKEINSDFAKMPPDGVVVVSEPLDYSYDHWDEMPKSSFATIQNGDIHIDTLAV